MSTRSGGLAVATATIRGGGPWPATPPSSGGSAKSTRAASPTRCIVHWPGRLSDGAGAVRHQFAHAVDVLPTVLELAGIELPTEIDAVPQTPVDGTSFAYLLQANGATQTERHVTQYFEMLGSRAIYHDGWKAVTFHPVGPLYDDGLDPNAPFDDDVWELYHVREDRSETHDLAADHPERVSELVELWWEEARRNDVLPLDNRVLEAIAHPKPDHRHPRDTFRYFPDGAQVPEPVAVNVRNRSHAITVTIEVPAGTVPNGVLLALGSALGGWSLHLVDGHLRYVHNLYGKTRYVLHADAALGSGRHTVGFTFEKDEGLGGPVHAAPADGDASWRGGRHRPLPPAGIQRRRGRRHVRVRMGSGGGRGLHGSLPVQRDHRAGRGDDDRSGRPGPRAGGCRHPGRRSVAASGKTP